MDISSPVKMEDMSLSLNQMQTFSEQGVDVFNSSSDFFNDKCHPYTSDNNTDIVLSERRNKYYQNVSLCASGCEYQGMNLTTQTVLCSCLLNSNKNKR